MDKKKKNILMDPEELEGKIILKDVVEEGKKVEKTSDNIYDADERKAMLEEESLRDYEEGFMEGASGRGQLHCCAYCGKLLGQDPSLIYEREFDGKILFFCSEEHAQKYAEKWQRKKEKRAEQEK